jgi:hypothetical protein
MSNSKINDVAKIVDSEYHDCLNELEAAVSLAEEADSEAVFVVKKQFLNDIYALICTYVPDGIRIESSTGEELCVIQGDEAKMIVDYAVKTYIQQAIHRSLIEHSEEHQLPKEPELEPDTYQP